MTNFSKVYSIQTVGLNATVINVEIDITKKSMQSLSVVGLPDRAVEESKDRISAALKNSGFSSPKKLQQKTIISLSPANLKKEGAIFDLAMAVGYLFANKEIYFNPKDKIFLGELSLNGELRPIKGVLVLVQKAKEFGFKEIYLPKQNAEEGALINDIVIYGVETLNEIVKHLTSFKEENEVELVPQEKTILKFEDTKPEINFQDIRGQETAKRGLEIAAAGKHHVAMYGPPGTGKTMLARAFMGILPKLEFEEILEVTGIHSIAGLLQDKLITMPPLRAPHHTASYTSIVGGGAFPRPGEITLAHKGVLFLDEFPEFERRLIESLRQPLEDKIINISRVKGSETFPANFLLIATMNPCPCGNFGTNKKRCVCAPSAIARYQKKLSGPIVDRIDIWLQVGQVEHIKLADKNINGVNSEKLRKHVIKARGIQKERFEKYCKKVGTNNEMTVKDLDKFAKLSDKAKKILLDSAQKFDLSARSYHKVIKVARTIADLEESENILDGHIMEALQYRPKQN